MLIIKRLFSGLSGQLGFFIATGMSCVKIPEQVREIKALLRDPDIQVADVARRYGVSRTTIYKHCGVVPPDIRSRP